MGTNAKAAEFLRECMADALIQLIPQKEFSKITVNEIAEAAGVNRSTWFRSFHTKGDALTYKLIQLWNRYAAAHSLAERQRFTLGNARDFFCFLYETQPLLKLLYSIQMQSAVYDAFYQVLMLHYHDGDSSGDAFEYYESRFYSYGLFGLLDEWVKRDFRETPQEMVSLFGRIMRSPSSQINAYIAGSKANHI